MKITKKVVWNAVFFDCDYIIKPECDSYMNGKRKLGENLVVSRQ